MNEQRIEAYLALIERLLTCEGGEEPQILNANLELIDKGLLQTMELVAAGWGSGARSIFAFATGIF